MTMPLIDALKGVTSIAFDTAPIIYFVERDTKRVDMMRTILQQVDQGMIAGYTSTITLTEVLTVPLKSGNTNLQMRYRTILRGSTNFHSIDIDMLIAESAAELRAKYALRTPDALQIATGIVMGCDAFVTNDKNHKRVTELKILVLDELTL